MVNGGYAGLDGEWDNGILGAELLQLTFLSPIFPFPQSSIFPIHYPPYIIHNRPCYFIPRHTVFGKIYGYLK